MPATPLGRAAPVGRGVRGHRTARSPWWGVLGSTVLVLFAAGCSSAVDRREVEQKVADQLTAQVGQAPQAIICPDDLAAEVGTRMRCQLRADDGSTIGVDLVVTSVQGTEVNWDIAVDDAPTPAAP